MNPRTYRVDITISPIDFPAIEGLGASSVMYLSEPVMVDNKLRLMISKNYVLINQYTSKQHVILAVRSVYEMPPTTIKTREDVYEFYKDATLGLNEVYQMYRREVPTLFPISFPYQPIEAYQKEIDRVFNLLSEQN